MRVYLVGGAVRDRLLKRAVKERDWVVVGRNARGTRAPGVRAGRARVPRVPASHHPRRARAGAPGAQGRARLSRLHHAVRADRDAGGRPEAPRPHHQRHGRGRKRRADRSLRRAGGPRGTPCCGTCPKRSSRTRYASCAWRASPPAMRSWGFASRRRPSSSCAASPRTAKCARSCPSASGRRPSAPSMRSTRRSTSRCCASAARWRSFFPEIDALFGVPQPPRWHPEIDTGVHVLLALRYAAAHAAPNPVRFAVLTHDLGKAADPEGRLAESPAARGIRGTADRGAVRAAAHPQWPSRACGADRPLPYARAPCARAQAGDAADAARELRRLPASGALR